MISIDGLDFGYGEKALFRQLQMSLVPGNIYGLLGLNGAGKSTLLKLMTGLLFPDAGTLSVLGRKPADREPAFLAQVFMLPEELNLPGITGEEYVSGLAPFYPRFDQERFERYSNEFELPRNTKLTAHSYGQKKKFLLAFGLASGTSLLVLDEPTNGLDIPSKGLFRRLVAEALTDDRVFVISTHQVKDVESLIDPIVILHQEPHSDGAHVGASRYRRAGADPQRSRRWRSLGCLGGARRGRVHRSRNPVQFDHLAA